MTGGGGGYRGVELLEEQVQVGDHVAYRTHEEEEE